MLLVLMVACSDGEDTGGSGVDCTTAPEVDWDGFGHGFVTTYCVSCHSEQNTDRRYGAPEGLDFDTEAEFYASGARVRARTIEEAILWHDGEGRNAKEAFRNMSASDRADLVKFLKSL